MKAKIQWLRLGLAALLIAVSTGSLIAAPPHTGIRGQSRYVQLGTAVEISPGVWVGDGGFSTPLPTSFSVLAHRSNHVLGHFSTDADGSFVVALPPGRYVVVPDKRSGLKATPPSFEITVKLRHFTDVPIAYQPGIISITPVPNSR